MLGCLGVHCSPLGMVNCPVVPLLEATRTLHAITTTTNTPSATRPRKNNTDPTTMPVMEAGDSSSEGGPPEAERLWPSVVNCSICSAIMSCTRTKATRMRHRVAVELHNKGSLAFVETDTPLYSSLPNYEPRASCMAYFIG